MKHGRWLAAAVLAAAVVAAGVYVAWAAWYSRIPGTYNVMQFGTVDTGGVAVPVGGAAPLARIHSVASLTGATAGVPDDRFTLVAEHARVRLASGKSVDALTFDGHVPGPELRVHTGDLVEVTLRNKDVAEGVTIHWHGIDVPNADDGVAGVTQNAVPPGGRYVYRFRVEQTGTFWYHTHQDSQRDVARGLYGAFVSIPRTPSPGRSLDLTEIAHTLDGVRVLNGNDRAALRTVQPGTHVRLRLVNSNDTTETLALEGTPFRILAIDGTDLHGPTPIRRRLLELAAGGRFDLGFVMPSTPVRLELFASHGGLVLSPSGGVAGSTPFPFAPDFDPFGYGTPAPAPFTASSHFDRSFRLEIQRKFGFENFRPGFHWTLNGRVYPHVPMFEVRTGDLVKLTIVNDTKATHPMHLHGHHALVLSRNGVPDHGSPWWTDTLKIDPGDTYVVAFRADNPGLWMDHCHNLRHASGGLTMHLMYVGVWTPYVIGGRAHNEPE